jgi:hypothetical protein
VDNSAPGGRKAAQIFRTMCLLTTKKLLPTILLYSGPVTGVHAQDSLLARFNLKQMSQDSSAADNSVPLWASGDANQSRESTAREARVNAIDVDEFTVLTDPALQAVLAAMLQLNERLQSIEDALVSLQSTPQEQEYEQVKEWYTPAEFSKAVDKTRYTVSEWCRLERINACKAQSGRGRCREWRISHQELERYQREGLLPLKYPGM